MKLRTDEKLPQHRRTTCFILGETFDRLTEDAEPSITIAERLLCKDSIDQHVWSSLEILTLFHGWRYNTRSATMNARAYADYTVFALVCPSIYTHRPGLHIRGRANVLAYTFNGLPHVALRCTERKSARRSPGHQDRENFSPRLGQLREYQQTLRVFLVLSPVSSGRRCRDKTHTAGSVVNRDPRHRAASPRLKRVQCAPGLWNLVLPTAEDTKI